MLRPHLLQRMVGLTTCDHHGEKEKFFCEEDQRVLCLSCRLAPEHKDHRVLPFETAADQGKDKLQETLIILQKKEEELKTALDKVREKEAYWKKNASTLKQSIISGYEKMHQFLWDEKCHHLQRLNEERRVSLLRLKENKAKLSHQIQNLQRLILEAEETLDKVPLEMLQDMTDSLKGREQLVLQEPEVASTAWLTFPITGLREVLRTFQRDITLDPASANPYLILSADLKSVQFGDVPQYLPESEDRFECILAVLGSQTFTSGKHYWEVEVGDKTEWELGICKDSVSRKEIIPAFSKDLRTIGGFMSGNHFFLFNSERGLKSRPAIQTVGIFLDYESGHIAFYDIKHRSLLHSVSNTAFEGPLRPYFSPCLPNRGSRPGSLIICPVEGSVGSSQ